MLRPAELVEDELILAIPVVPVKPGSEAVERDWPVQADEEMRANPFAALKGLKKHSRQPKQKYPQHPSPRQAARDARPEQQISSGSLPVLCRSSEEPRVGTEYVRT